MQETNSIEIVLNGEARRVPAGSTLLELVESLGLDPGGVAVELDRVIVRRAEWEAAALAGGSRVEIVQFVGGG